MTLEQLARQGRRAESQTTAATIGLNRSMIKKDFIKQSFIDFEHIQHRSEYVDLINEVTYYDDSGALTCSATWFTFENLNTPVVWIAGAGNVKDDFEELIPMVKKYVKALICVGDNVASMHEAFDSLMKGKIFDADSLDKAVTIASGITMAGESVLFSPSCDVDKNFSDYAQRGDYYKDIVKKMKGV